MNSLLAEARDKIKRQAEKNAASRNRRRERLELEEADFRENLEDLKDGAKQLFHLGSRASASQPTVTAATSDSTSAQQCPQQTPEQTQYGGYSNEHSWGHVSGPSQSDDAHYGQTQQPAPSSHAAAAYNGYDQNGSQTGQTSGYGGSVYHPFPVVHGQIHQQCQQSPSQLWTAGGWNVSQPQQQPWPTIHEATTSEGQPQEPYPNIRSNISGNDQPTYGQQLQPAPNTQNTSPGYQGPPAPPPASSWHSYKP